MDARAQHFTVWKAFNDRIYNRTLTSEHIKNGGNEKFIEYVFHIIKNKDNVYEINEDKGLNTKCMFLEKDGIKYIMPSVYKKFLPFTVKKGFDCYLKTSDKTVYHCIETPLSVKLGAEKTLSFKDLIDVFNPMEHTDLKTWTFLRVQAIASKAKGAKYRLCSEPETGKNANDTILHLISNDNICVPKPTLAKLETLFYFNQKVILDEMTALSPTQVKEIEPFFLSMGDERPSFQKHSLAKKHDMNEVDITKSSCIFTYNDTSSVHNESKFFDDIWSNTKAFNSRYPALKLSGKIVTEMPKLAMVEAKVIMEDNFKELRAIAKNIVYYIDNMTKELHGYDRSKLGLRGRKRVNFEAVIDALDVYSSTQEEFDEWLVWINDKVKDYNDMIHKHNNPDNTWVDYSTEEVEL